MAKADQNVGYGDDLVFAGDTIRLAFTVTTGGTAAGVTVAEWGLFDKDPALATGALTPLVSKTLGSGITVADGTVTGTVDVSVIVQPADTDALAGDYFHVVKMTASGDVEHVAKGAIRLHRGAL